MSGDGRQPQHLPRGLTSTVRVVQAILGEVVAEAEGRALYEAVEDVRRDMVAFRETGAREQALDRARERLEALSVDEKLALARAYTLYLELVNVCENAYRTHRLRERLGPRTGDGEARARLTLVLTAHPTESRSPENIRLLRRIQDHLVECLEEDLPVDREEIRNLLHVAWRVGTHPPRRPSVEDEANHLFSLLTDPLLAELVALTRAGHRLLLRTWVGGDKDGHPGVGPEQTEASLGLSRRRLLEFVRARLLDPAREDVALVSRAAVGREAAAAAAAERDAGKGELEAGAGSRAWGTGASSADAPAGRVASAFAELEAALAALEPVTDGDGGRIATLELALERFQAAYRARLGIEHPRIARLATLLEIFPALVVPLELREERGRFGPGEPIADMLRRLREIAGGDGATPIDAYARAVVVSMTCAAEDMLEAQRLVVEVLGEPEIPVVPLFELPEVLERAPAILGAAWEDEGWRRAVEERGHVEVMLGYSDTAKRMGMLASRVSLHRAMRAIAGWAGSAGIVPRFFHGHGGSVGRGGGRIEDLAATWPPEAREPYKYTVQGEMVERTLATPEILRSLVEKVASVQHDPPPYRGIGTLAEELAEASKRAFETVVASESFRRLLREATPYARLQALTIGSRPSARGGPDAGQPDAEQPGTGQPDAEQPDAGGSAAAIEPDAGGSAAATEPDAGGSAAATEPDAGGALERLRAIPWVLCWTQTRLLLHAWLGAGEAWSARRREPGIEALLEEARREDPLFRSYARLLSFTLAKAAPELWRRYHRVLAPGIPEERIREIEAQREAARDLALRAIGADTLLPDRPWLEESIRYRAPMIHPLNLLQIELLAKRDWSEAEVRLFRETVTGIAAGMLTTG